MQLKDFITASLAQIIEGVVAAQKIAEKHNAFINPTVRTPSKIGERNFVEIPGTGDTYYEIKDVEFDVAVTVSESTEKEGGIAIAAVLAIGGKAGSSSSMESVNRIQFKVPVAFPIQEAKPRPHVPA